MMGGSKESEEASGLGEGRRMAAFDFCFKSLYPSADESLYR